MKHALLITLLISLFVGVNSVNAAESGTSIDYCQQITYEDAIVTECDLLTEDAIVPIVVEPAPQNGVISALTRSSFTQNSATYNYQRIEYCSYTQSYMFVCYGKKGENT